MRSGVLVPLATLIVLPGCADPDPDPSPSTCVTGVSTACAAQYDPPIYPTIFEKILHPTCAAGTGTCHSADAAQGGLVFEDADQAYATLLGTEGQRARVVAGDAACSLLVERLEASDAAKRMPPGPEPLTEGERCTIVQWIAAGAAR